MKVRHGFVSNSSSSSFLILLQESDHISFCGSLPSGEARTNLEEFDSYRLEDMMIVPTTVKIGHGGEGTWWEVNGNYYGGGDMEFEDRLMQSEVLFAFVGKARENGIVVENP